MSSNTHICRKAFNSLRQNKLCLQSHHNSKHQQLISGVSVLACSALARSIMIGHCFGLEAEGFGDVRVLDLRFRGLGVYGLKPWKSCGFGFDVGGCGSEAAIQDVGFMAQGRFQGFELGAFSSGLLSSRTRAQPFMLHTGLQAARSTVAQTLEPTFQSRSPRTLTLEPWATNLGFLNCATSIATAF